MSAIVLEKALKKWTTTIISLLEFKRTYQSDSNRINKNITNGIKQLKDGEGIDFKDFLI